MITRGQMINERYEIIRSIGEGGMANVYLALDTILNRKVAVKILRGDLAEDEKFIRRFQYVESTATQQGKRLEEMSLEEMDMLWDAAKSEE